MSRRRRWLAGGALLLVLAGAVLALATWRALLPLPATLGQDDRPAAERAPVFAADGTPLTVSFSGRYNHSNALPLSALPPLLRQAFVSAEDRRFWQHGGSDWRARLAALWSNLRAGRVVRGASTIAEQSVRLIAPRPRTYWSHWVEGWDARRLLRRFGRARVLQFYLNQVPYAAQRRGVAQAAHYYFGREPAALNSAQQLALAVLVRSPAHYDPRRHPDALRRAVDRLAARMQADGLIPEARRAAIERSPLRAGERPLRVDAGPFVVHARRQAQAHGFGGQRLRTTLDAPLQAYAQQVLRRRQQELDKRQVRNGAAIVVDNASGHILAWAVAPAGNAHDIDPVVTPRQPGSTLKPFVYALALTRLGWQADHELADTPLVERIDDGTHRYRNYSGKQYGRVSLRYALGNSLNIPVVRTAVAVGVQPIMDLFANLGFTSFEQSPQHYGAAIALGDGEVSLLQLVQAYSALARRGQFLPLTALADATRPDPRPVLPPAVSSLVADILADGEARAAEFGADSLLNLPTPTAMKTGTSSDYHDSWTVGFDDHYTVGVWLGRLDGGYMDRVTGSEGAAPVVRQLFTHLRKHAPTAGLWRSPELQPFTSCEWLGETCTQRREWRLPELPDTASAPAPAMRRPHITRPLPDERLALDPRLPRAAQRYRLMLDAGGQRVQKVEWLVNDQPLPGSADADQSQQWTLEPGTQAVSARVWVAGRDAPWLLEPVHIHVAGGTAAGDPDPGQTP